MAAQLDIHDSIGACGSRWAPILPDDLRGRAESVLADIARTVLAELHEQDDIRLMSGTPGQLLFLMGYLGSRFDPEEEVDKLFQRISSNSRFDGSLMSGLAGIGYTLKLMDDRCGLFDEELFQDIFASTRRLVRLLILEGKYDFMHGYLGGCYFLLEEEYNPGNFSLFQDMVYAIGCQSIPLPVGIGWISPSELWVNYPNRDFSSIQKDGNLGLAHGSPGIALALARLGSRYTGLEVSGLIERALACLIYEESETNHEQYGYYYRLYSGELGKRYRGQLSWCHSDLGVSMAYFNLWKLTGDASLFGRAKKVAEACAQKRYKDVPSLCSGLCHGAAGAAHMFNKIYRFTGDDQFLEAARYWYSVLFDKFLVSGEDGKIRSIDIDRKTDRRKVSIDNGLLDGLSGIGLSVLSAITDEDPDWDKILLL